MTNGTLPKFTLYVDNLSVMSSDTLLNSSLPLLSCAIVHYKGHHWYIKNNWTGAILCDSDNYPRMKKKK